MLTLRNLSKFYGKTAALSDLSLDVDEGEVLCVLGPSGCGKSTLLKLISGMDSPDQGSIHINNRLIADKRSQLAPEHRRINMVFQDYALWPHMKVRSIIGYGLGKLTRLEREQRVDRLLDMLQITAFADRLPGQLSGGQQQRVAIARALATEPDLLLFDEPLSNLDVQLRQEMRHELSDLFKRLNKTVLYVTHDPMEASAFADKLLVLKNGQIEQFGAASHLFERPSSPWVATLAGYDNRLEGVVDQVVSDHLVRVLIQGQTIHARLPENSGLVPRQPVLILFPSDSLSVAAKSEGDDHQNRLQTRVDYSIYEGRSWRVRMSLAGAAFYLNHNQTVDDGTTLDLGFPVQETLAFGLESPQKQAAA